jgi:hypothetical protein
VVVAPEVPLKVTVAPDPPAVGLIVPEIENVGGGVAVAVKFNPVTLAEAIVVPCDPGVNVNPVLLGVTVYAPFASPVKVYAPEAFAVIVAPEAPLSVTVAPLPPAVGLMVPEIENVGAGVAVAVKFKFVTLAEAIVVACDPGANVNPVWLGVTVYAPFASPVKV